MLNGGGDIPELPSDPESGAESFLTDDEVAYQEELDPVEDSDYQQQISPESVTVTSSSAPVPAELSQPSERTPAVPQLARMGRATSRKVNYAVSSEEEEEQPSTTAVRKEPGKRRANSRGGYKSSLSSSSVASATAWNSEDVSDSGPVQKRFIPARTPGHQLSSTNLYTPLDLFKLFFTDDVLLTLCNNTNKQAAKNISKGKKYSWTHLTTQELQKFWGLNFYCALVKVSAVQDYWRTNSVFSLTFPPSVMSRNKFLTISWNVHMSNPDEDIENNKKKGTTEHKRLFRLKPLLLSIQDACKAYYHPMKNLAVDEQMVASKAHTSMTQYMKAKPTK